MENLLRNIVIMYAVYYYSLCSLIRNQQEDFYKVASYDYFLTNMDHSQKNIQKVDLE